MERERRTVSNASHTPRFRLYPDRASVGDGNRRPRYPSRVEPIGLDIGVGRGGTAYRILVVEDAFLLVTLLQDLFDGLGWVMVGPATRLVDALQLAREETFDAALLDVNLDGTMSWDVAMVLRDRGIPFAFGTGYNVAAILPEDLAGTPVIGKPYQVSELQQVIHHAISARLS